MKAPPTKKLKPPLYYVTMCDMFNLLLAFYICMVAMADTRSYGLVGAGQGPQIKHLLAEGKPGIGTGSMKESGKKYPLDNWWVENQQGDPDQLESVQNRLEGQFAEHFAKGEASMSYARDSLVVTLPARIEFDANGQPRMTPAVMDALRLIAETLRAKPGRRIRVSGDVPASGSFDRDLFDSSRLGYVASYFLQRLGVEPWRVSLWGWGSSRPMIASRPGDPANRSLTIEIYDPPRAGGEGR